MGHQQIYHDQNQIIIHLLLSVYLYLLYLLVYQTHYFLLILSVVFHL
nr:MAG TPA: hypothetical protein [Caudoviricetes sp.]